MRHIQPFDAETLSLRLNTSEPPLHVELVRLDYESLVRQCEVASNHREMGALNIGPTLADDRFARQKVGLRGRRLCPPRPEHRMQATVNSHTHG